MRWTIGMALSVLILSGCAGDPVYDEIPGATGPQYEPGDPCKGVVPQLCVYG